MKAVTKTLVLQSFISNGWACCTPGYCTSTSSDTLTGKMGKTVILAVFTCFSKKSTQFIERQRFFSAAPWTRTANRPLFLHPSPVQRLIPSWLGQWPFQGSQQFPGVNRFGRNSGSRAVKCSLVSRANLLLTQTKMAHLRNTCGLTLPGFNRKYPLGFTMQLPFNVTTGQWGQRFSFFSSYCHQKGDNWQLALVDLDFKLMLFGIF